MTNGPNQPGNPDLTPEIFENIDWSEVVDKHGEVDLGRIKGVKKGIRDKIIDVIDELGGKSQAERALAEKRIETQNLKTAFKELYGHIFGLKEAEILDVRNAEFFNKIEWTEAVKSSDRGSEGGEDIYGQIDLNNVGGLTSQEKGRFLEIVKAEFGNLNSASDALREALHEEFYKYAFSKGGEVFQLGYEDIYGRSNDSEMEAFVRNVAKRVFGGVFGVKMELNIFPESDDDPKELVLRNGEWVVPPKNTEIPRVNKINEETETGVPDEMSAELEVSESLQKDLNRYLKLQLRTKDGKPDLTKRDDLSVGISVLKELAEEDGTGVAEVLNGRVMESSSPADLFKKEREVAGAEGDLSKLTDAAKFFGDASAKKFNELVAKAGTSKITIDESDVDIEDKSSEISQLRQQIDVSKSELSNPKLSSSVAEKPLLVDMYGKEIKSSSATDVSERKSIRDDVAENIRKLAVNEKIQKAFEDREKFVKELYESLTTLFVHLSVLVKNKCFPDEMRGDAESVNEWLNELNTMSRSLNFSKLSEIVKFLCDGNGLLSEGKKDKVLSASDQKREQLADKLRTDKKSLEFAKQNAEGNADLTDSAFALRIIKYKLLKDPENKKLSLEDLEKLAKRTLVEQLWKFRTQKALGEAVDGAPTDLVEVFKAVAVKEKVLKLNYKIGDAKKEPFKGITPNDLKDEKTIENLFASGRVDLKKAFMLLSAIGNLANGASTSQYRFLQKKIFDLLGEEGLTPAQAIKAFNDQMEKVDAVVLQYAESSKKAADNNKKIKELKTEKAMEKYRRGEIDYTQLQDELEDAGVLKDGKLTEGSVSRLGLFTGYLWNNRKSQWVRDRLTDVARDTGKFLGRNLIVAPLYLGGKWALKGGASLLGSAIAKPFRLVGYPLALLKAPWHVLRHPIKIFKKPGEVFKEAGGKVKETWSAKAKATEERRKKRWEAAKAEMGKWKEPFKGAKYEWKSSYKDKAAKNPSKDLAKLDTRIERLKKKVDETEVVLTEEPFLDYSKYKTKTTNEERKAA